MESIRKLTTVEKQEVNNYFKEQLKEQREIMKTYYKQEQERMKKQQEIDK